MKRIHMSLKNGKDSFQWSVMLADTFFTRLLGLLFRKPLGAGEGLLIVPCNSVHTFGMCYAIDVVFLDEDGRILRIVSNLSPGRIRGVRSAKTVLELRAGAAAGMEVGDVVGQGKDC